MLIQKNTSILSQKQYPEQNYKSRIGISKKAKKIKKERSENVFKRALQFDVAGYNKIKNILEKGFDKLEKQVKLFYIITIQDDNTRGWEDYISQ